MPGPLSTAHTVTKLPSAGAPSGASTQMTFEVEDLKATLADLRAQPTAHAA